jgi:hypothetical protein
MLSDAKHLGVAPLAAMNLTRNADPSLPLRMTL